MDHCIFFFFYTRLLTFIIKTNSLQFDWQLISSWGSRAAAALGQPAVPTSAAPWIWKAKHLHRRHFCLFFFFLPVVAQPPRLFGALSYWILTWGNSAATFQPFSDGGIRVLTPEDYSRCSVSTSLCVVVLRARYECRLPPSRNQHGGNRGFYCFISLDLPRQRTTEPCFRGSVLLLLGDIKCAIVISNHLFGGLLLCVYINIYIFFFSYSFSYSFRHVFFSLE